MGSSEGQQVDLPTCSNGHCPVCLQIPRANIYQCANGHSICEDCSAKVTLCPTCRSSGVRIRNLYAESLLDDLIFKCGWSGRGCDKSMLRSQLSAHEDQCEHKPLEVVVLNFCSKFPEARNCPYNFTSKWLSEPENCTNFKNHVVTCLNCLCFEDVQYREPFLFNLCFDDMASKKFNPTRLAHHSYSPFFYRLPSPNQEDKVDLLALFFLLNFDAGRNQRLSFAFVQLTPPPLEEEEETTQMVVEIRIDGKPSSNMVSQHGESSLPSKSWTQKPMGFNQFLEMVENSTDVPLPFSLPVSVLSENYSSEDRTLNVQCTVIQPIIGEGADENLDDLQEQDGYMEENGADDGGDQD